MKITPILLVLILVIPLVVAEELSFEILALDANNNPLSNVVIEATDATKKMYSYSEPTNSEGKSRLYVFGGNQLEYNGKPLRFFISAYPPHSVSSNFELRTPFIKPKNFGDKKITAKLNLANANISTQKVAMVLIDLKGKQVTSPGLECFLEVAAKADKDQDFNSLPFSKAFADENGICIADSPVLDKKAEFKLASLTLNGKTFESDGYIKGWFSGSILPYVGGVSKTERLRGLDILVPNKIKECPSKKHSCF